MPAGIIDLTNVDQPVVPPEVTILLVEDEVIVAEDVRRRLENLGYTVIGIATRGKDAIAMTMKFHPRLILMDIGLRGGMDGIETVRAIREQVDVPVIFASAYSDDVTLQRAREAEPQGFVLKPFEERELRTTVELALYKHATEQTLRANESTYRNVFEKLTDGLLLESAARKVLHANPAFCKMFKISSPASIIGADTRTGLASHEARFKDYSGLLRWKEECIESGKAVAPVAFPTHDNLPFYLGYIPIHDQKNGLSHLWQYREQAKTSA
jgi:CheY-like chemotaxis protein